MGEARAAGHGLSVPGVRQRYAAAVPFGLHELLDMAFEGDPPLDSDCWKTTLYQRNLFYRFLAIENLARSDSLQSTSPVLPTKSFSSWIFDGLME